MGIEVVAFESVRIELVALETVMGIQLVALETVGIELVTLETVTEVAV